MNRLLILAAACVFAVAVQAADFRSANWGMTVNEIRALHSGELSANQGRGMIEYDAKLGELDVRIFYLFDELGKLHQAGYRSMEKHTDNNLHVADFRSLNALLRRKYPQSSAPVEVWTNRLFEAKPGQWGRAIYLGHLTLRWEHSVEHTRILHTLSGDRREIAHVVRYEQIAAQSEDAEDDGQSVLDEL